MSHSYEYFNNLYEIPYTTVAILYTFAVFAVIIIKIVGCCREKGCCRCCGCSLHWPTKFSRWLIRLVFGNSEGISEANKPNQSHEGAGQGGRQGNGQGESDDAGQGGSGQIGSKLGYIHIDTLTTLEVNIFGAIILCFGLLMAIAAYSVYLLEVSHTCSEDTAIYCFPMLIDSDNPENPNITRDEMMYPITDCSLWVNSSVAPLITFQCFRFSYNAQAALATAGGLLALFTVVMRITITGFLKLFWVLKCIEKKCTGIAKCCLNFAQGCVVFVLFCIDIVLTFMVLSFQLNENVPTGDYRMLESGDDPTAELTGRYLGENGIQLLVGAGTTTLLLLIPWSNYAEDPKPDQGANDMELKTRKKDESNQ